MVSKLFENNTVIISGGLGDIGRAMALEFAQHGANIALGDRHSMAQARGFMSELGRHNVRCHYQRVDVTVAKAVRAWVRKVEDTLGAPSVIIANAAAVTLAGLYEITARQWSREIAVNLDGAFHLTQIATARLLALGRPGRVVFIGSWAAATVHAHIPAYCVSKAGLRMLCKCMALELAPHGILVNEIAPGYVNGGLSRRVWKQNPKLHKQAQKKVPVRKLISPQEVAGQVVQLCHPHNQHITGGTLLMDGGLSLLST